jgi:hypothetical protein
MTDLAVSHRQPAVVRLLHAMLTRLAAWLNEEVSAPGEADAEFSPRDWADLPTYHPDGDRYSR